MTKEPLPRLQHDSPPPQSVPRRTRYWRRVFSVSVVVCLLALVLCFYLFPWASIGTALVHKPVLEQADAVVLLGGGGLVRASHAARLIQEGWAPFVYVLLPEPALPDTPVEEIETYEPIFVQGVFDRHGIQEDRIEWCGSRFLSTYDEIMHLQRWSIQRDIRKVIVVSGWYQSGRAQWCVERILPEWKNRILISPAPYHELDTEQWWRHEDTIIHVQNEWLKHFYYRLQALTGQK